MIVLIVVFSIGVYAATRIAYRTGFADGYTSAIDNCIYQEHSPRGEAARKMFNEIY